MRRQPSSVILPLAGPALPALPQQQDIRRAAAAVLGLGVAVGKNQVVEGADPAKSADLSRFIL